jgi:poly(3-hydroxybutyrate) depolymerase
LLVVAAALGLVALGLARGDAGAPAAASADFGERGRADASAARLLAPLDAAPAVGRAPLVEPGSELVLDEFFVRVPPVLEGRLNVLVALHGMEGQGRAFCDPLRTRTDRDGWLVVAPTYAYGDWQDPSQVAREESTRFIPRLREFLAGLPERTGLTLNPQVAIYGASRGAQLAERFALVYPNETRAVAALSAGTYTLPAETFVGENGSLALPYPFGTADLTERFGRPLDRSALRRVAFWFGVGDLDRDPADVPRQWDRYVGDNRVARAETIARRLGEMGAPVEFALIPNLGHALSDEAQERALDFLFRAVSAAPAS